MSERSLLGAKGAYYPPCLCCNSPRDTRAMKRLEQRQWHDDVLMGDGIDVNATYVDNATIGLV